MKRLAILFVVLAVILSGCTALQAAGPAPTPFAGGSANLPNPASAYCKEHGGVVEIRTDATGAQHGVCRFPDGSECDEWAYFRGECIPRQHASISTGTPAPSAVQMTEEQARAIAAKASACTEAGPLKDRVVFNPNSQTWWIGLDSAKPGCNPACVVSADGAVEVNWRCTAAMPPAGTPAKP